MLNLGKQMMGISWDDLVNDNWEPVKYRGLVPLTQEVADMVIGDGYAGVLVNRFVFWCIPEYIILVFRN